MRDSEEPDFLEGISRNQYHHAGFLGYRDALFLSYKQAQDKGGHFEKDEKG